MSVVPRVVIIDDNPGGIELVRIAFALRGMPLVIDTASNGEQGIDLLKQLDKAGSLPHLILLDLNMPGLSGFDVLAFLQVAESLRKVPAIILSSSNAPADRERGLRLGARAYLVKPDTLDGLLALLGGCAEFFPT